MSALVNPKRSLAEHPWTKAGLGLAPFVWLGVERKVGPIIISQKDGVTTSVGAPGQPMGSCNFCGQGIADCHKIRSADGKEFIVGSDCVRRVSDKRDAVLTDVERAMRDQRNSSARARGAVKAKASADRVKELMANEALRSRLASEPSAYEWKRAEGATALDDLEWLAKQCGHSGRTRLIARLEKLVAEVS